MSRQRGLEAGQEAVARALQVEAAEALEALAHRGDADRDQVFGIVSGRRLVADQACFHASVPPPRNGLSSASPNGTLSGNSLASRRSVTVPALRGRP